MLKQEYLERSRPHAVAVVPDISLGRGIQVVTTADLRKRKESAIELPFMMDLLTVFMLMNNKRIAPHRVGVEAITN